MEKVGVIERKNATGLINKKKMDDGKSRRKDHEPESTRRSGLCVVRDWITTTPDEMIRPVDMIVRKCLTASFVPGLE